MLQKNLHRIYSVEFTVDRNQMNVSSFMSCPDIIKATGYERELHPFKQTS